MPDAVVGQAPVESVGQVRGREVPDLVPGADGGDAEGDQDMAFAGAGGPTRHRFSAAVTHSREAR